MIDLKPACSQLIDLLVGVQGDQLASPTPCGEYTVRDLLDHVDEVAQSFADMAGNRDGEPTDPGSGTGTGTDTDTGSGDWRKSVAAHVWALGEAWDDPAAWQGKTDVGGLELSNELWGKIAFTELVVHGWDLAKATEQPFDLPEQTLRACLDHVTEFVPNAPIPALWGSAVEVPADAPLIDQVVAITGRTP